MFVPFFVCLRSTCPEFVNGSQFQHFCIDEGVGRRAHEVSCSNEFERAADEADKKLVDETRSLHDLRILIIRRL